MDDLLNRLVKYVDRDFADGDRLPSERDLADRFGVSRNQLRESLSKLEAFRLVAVREKSRAVVTKGVTGLDQLALRAEVGIAIDPREIQQAIEVRQIMEFAAVQLACERARDEDFDRLQDVLDAAGRKISRGLPIAEEDELFHMTLIRSTQNAVLVQMALPFYAMTRARRQIYFADIKRCRTSQREHVKLFSALRKRDADLAAAMIGDHLRGAARHWSGLLAKWYPLGHSPKQARRAPA